MFTEVHQTGHIIILPNYSVMQCTQYTGHTGHMQQPTLPPMARLYSTRILYTDSLLNQYFLTKRQNCNIKTIFFKSSSKLIPAMTLLFLQEEEEDILMKLNLMIKGFDLHAPAMMSVGFNYFLEPPPPPCSLQTA